MYFEIFGFVLTTKKELDNREQEVSNTFTTTIKKVLQEQRDLLDDQHDAELDRLERVTASHHDTLKKALNYMMTALGGVPMEGYDSSELPEGKIPELIVSDEYKEPRGVEYAYTNSIYVPVPTPEPVQYKGRRKPDPNELAHESDLRLSRDASNLIPDLEAELKRLRDAQKDILETDPTNDAHIRSQDSYDLDGAGINDVLGIWGSAIASVQNPKTNPDTQAE